MEHKWVAVPPGGPAEEGGVCEICGAWATSEEHTSCPIAPDPPEETAPCC